MAQTTFSLLDPANRRALTYSRPLRFGQLYFGHHLTAEDGSQTFAECHYEWARIAKSWMKPNIEPLENRHAFLAPRATGKSTWWLLILPMWAAAHGHVKFASFFADTYSQAQQHAATFRRELETNELLRRDFPELCAPAKTQTGVQESNTKELLIRQNGFVLTSKGMDSGALGMKVGERRPDLLLLDDIEPDEANYSGYQAEKRLGTLLDAILPLNIRARVVLSGTVTMPGSITHQIVKHGQGIRDEENAWVGTSNFQVHHSHAIVDNGDGSRRSQWPEKWSLEWLESIEHTREYAKNYANNPRAVDSDYWSDKDFTYGGFPTTKTILSVDGAVTGNKTSDFTGLAVVSYAPKTQSAPARCLVEHCEAVRLKGEPLRARVESLLRSFPDISVVYVEANQGGELWRTLFRGIDAKVITHTVHAKKEVRAGKLLKQYQLVPSRVWHAKPLPALEDQQIAFPKAPNDDMVDAVGNGVDYFLKQTASVAIPSSGIAFPGARPGF